MYFKKHSNMGVLRIFVTFLCDFACVSQSETGTWASYRFTSLDWQRRFISGGLGVFGKDKHYLASGNSRAVSTGSFKWLK